MTTGIKNSVDGLNSVMEGPKKKISELEDRMIEIAQCEQQKYQTGIKKVNRASGAC